MSGKRKKRNSSKDQSTPNKKKTNRKTTMAKEVNKEEVKLPGENASMRDWGTFLYGEITKMNQSIQGKLDTSTREMKESNQMINKCTATIAKLIQENKLLKEHQQELNEKILRLGYHGRRNNLVFDGFDEVLNETNQDCYNKVRSTVANLFDDDEGLDSDTPTGQTAFEKASKIVVNRIHRLGKPIRGRNRQIIVNFQWYQDREFILQNRKNLPKGVYVNEDFPPEIVQRRNILRPILKQALSMPKFKGKVSLRYDKLIIMGQSYTMANIEDIPADLSAETSCQKSSNTHVGFFGIHSPFSNFHPCKIKVDNITYSCAEQYIQSDKVTFCNDDRSKFKIMSTKDPREMKFLSSRLVQFNQQKWEQERMKLSTYNIIWNKFSQN